MPIKPRLLFTFIEFYAIISEKPQRYIHYDYKFIQ